MTGLSDPVVCRTCGETLHGPTAKLREKESEVERLRSRVWAFEADLEHAQGPFMASRRRNRFHRRDCPWAGYLNDFNSIEFSTRLEAIESGYRPCGTCKS